MTTDLQALARRRNWLRHQALGLRASLSGFCRKETYKDPLGASPEMITIVNRIEEEAIKLEEALDVHWQQRRCEIKKKEGEGR